MEYLAALNSKQKEAVLKTQGPVSILAGAGSGKTRVLTTRILHLMREGTPGNRILAVTFTNKAAREMRERVDAALHVPYEARRSSSELPFIGTFHGLGRELLERHGRVIGVPRFFSIFDRDDSERAIKEALKEMGIDPKETPPRAVLARISKAKGEGMTVDEWSEGRAKESFRTRVALDAWRRYEATLRKEKALDFDDLIALPVRLLAEHPEIRRDAQDVWDYIHVDEYQDTNVLQARLANLLAEKHQNLFVVGDIDQTIYTWRGATIENLLSFEKTYPDATTIILEHNYRSTKTIVSAANSVIEKNKKRKEKRSVTDNDAGAAITLFVAGNADGEAAWVAHETARTIETGTKPEDIAVLFRTNFQSRAFEEAFLRAGIPYRLLGTRFFERKEVKDVLSWARLALDSSREADRMRAVQAPPCGVGKTTLGKLVAGKRRELRAGELARVEAFEKTVADLAHAAETSAPSIFVRLILEKSGLETVLQKGGEDDLERLENAKELATFASRHDHTIGHEGIAAFLAEAALASDQDEMDREKKTGVLLMTVHAAKGLEFDTVFITGLEEGLFPHEGHENDDERDEEEERRLFYVALTRAKQRLILTLARVRRLYGTDYLSEPSSFLSDIDASLMTYATPDSNESVIHI